MSMGYDAFSPFLVIRIAELVFG